MSGAGKTTGKTWEAGPARPRAAFYCVTDSRYFLGAVGMLNSLRLLGHAEPLFVLDCGLTPDQRELLAPHASLVPAPGDTPPDLLKTVAPLRHPAEVMVLIDGDLIVTRPLTELLAKASEGNVVAFENASERFVPEWGELLGLGTACRRQYVSASLLFLGGQVGSEVLRLLDDRQDRVDFELTLWRKNVRNYPFLYGDQDVLNAILATRVDPRQVICVQDRLEAVPPFAGVRVLNSGTLHCAYEDGVEPYVVHHYLPEKPWLKATAYGVYTELLRRLLLGHDVAVKVPRETLPLHLRAGLLAYAKRRRGTAGPFRWYIGRPLASGARAVRDRVRG